jgi:putative chitinase
VPVISSESLNPTATPVTSLPNPQSSSTTMDSSQSESGVHIVQPGENLYRISLNYDVSMQELARLNGITNPDMIYVGQRLKVPGLMGEGGMAGDGVHIVQPGESLMSIALSYNSSVAALMAANNLANPDFIYVGQRLVIP